MKTNSFTSTFSSNRLVECRCLFNCKFRSSGQAHSKREQFLSCPKSQSSTKQECRFFISVQDLSKYLEGVTMPKFEVKDLESLEGKYNTVICLDVLIHYPQEKAEGMIAHLASLAERRLLLSFAPKTLFYNLLKRVGELFPGPSKATRAYLHAERDVERALEKVGWRVNKRGFISTQFYFANLIEAVPIGMSN